MSPLRLAFPHGFHVRYVVVCSSIRTLRLHDGGPLPSGIESTPALTHLEVAWVICIQPLYLKYPGHTYFKETQTLRKPSQRNTGAIWWVGH